MANSEYITSTCKTCGGSGSKLDATALDKVDAGPNPHRCNACRGTGATQKLRSLVELQKRETATTRARLAAPQEITETPSWML